MKHLRAFLLLSGWLGAAYWYWREWVPLVPMKSMAIPEQCYVNRNTAAGGASEIAFVPWRRERAGSISRPVGHGPVEFWSLPELRRDRTLYTEQDEFVAGPIQTREALVRRSGRLEIRIWETGELIATLPNLEPVRDFRMIPGRGQVLLQVGQDLQLFDFNAVQPRWIATEYRMQSRIVDDIIIVRRSNSGSQFPPKRDATAFDIIHGQPDARFDAAGPCDGITLSKTGRFAALRNTRGACSVCDFATGKLLWRTPAGVPVDHCFFSDNDAVLCGHDARVDSSVLLRWNAEDGQALPSLSEADDRVLRNLIAGEGRFAVDSAVTRPPRQVIPWINSQWRYLDRWRDRLWQSLHQWRYGLIEQQTGRLIGYFPDDHQPFIVKGDAVIGTVSPTRLNLYSLPPHRDYGWLAMWGCCRRRPSSCCGSSGIE